MANMAAEANVVPELAQNLTALYVGDLDGSVTEEELYRLFNQAGDVVSVKICGDEMNQRSLGYGYVNFSNPDDAEKALEVLNFTRLKGKCIRIAYSNREGSHRKSGQGNIFVKNLDEAIDHKALHDIFRQFGQIMSCKVETDSGGRSKGYGYVQYKNEEAAAAAMRHLHGATFYGKELHAVPYVSRQEREMCIDKTKFTNVFVKNISASTTDEDLKSVFGEFGTTSSVAVMRDEAGNSKCFGFVNFERSEDAAAAVRALNGREFNGKVWYVGRAQKKSERELEMKQQRELIAKEILERSLVMSNIYIKNLDDFIDDEKLRAMFSPFGAITSCKVMTDTRGISRGHGFVAFATELEASRAIAAMNGKMIGSKPLYVSIAERKEARHQRLQSMFSSNMYPATMMPPPVAPLPPQIPCPGEAFFYGNVAQPGFMYPQERFVPRFPLVQNFMFPAMMQRPSNSRHQPPLLLPPPPPPPMHHQTPFRGFTSTNAAPQGTTMPMHNTGVVDQVETLASALANASPSDQKKMLGANLYPLVEKLEPEMASKVTGMLLEMDQTEVLHLLESPHSLTTKVAEAMDVLANAPPRRQTTLSDQLAFLSLN